METMTKNETTTTKKMVKFNGPKQELVEILNGLYASSDLPGKAFALASSRNIVLIKDILEDIEKLALPSKEFLELSEKVKLVQSDEDAADKIKTLEEEVPEVVEARKAQLEAVKSMLEEEVSVELNAISENDLPEDIKSHQVTLLNKLIK